MAESQRITDPSLLEQHKILTESSKSSQTLQTTLVLLQPLATAEILAACRKPDSSISSPSNHEYLDIGALSKIWRQATMKMPPIPSLVFDLILPIGDRENTDSSKVYWDTAMPAQERSLGIHARDVMTLVMTLATETRMRCEGEVKFEVKYGEDEGVSLRAMRLLEKQLLVLAEVKVIGDKREQSSR